MIDTKEFRLLPMAVKAMRVDDADDGPPVLRGYGAVFDQWSVDLGGFREKIDRGAFADTIKSDDVVSLFNHDMNLPLARLSAGTLRLKEDKEGLATEIDIPDTSIGRDLAVNVANRTVQGQSFGFYVEEERWEKLDTDEPERTLLKVRLVDVGPVTNPAYPDTTVALRWLEEAKSIHLAPMTSARFSYRERHLRILELN